MAVTAATTDLPPLYFSVGQQINAEDLRAVNEQLNWSVLNAVPCFISMTTASAGWATGTLGTHFAVIDQAALETVFEFDLYVPVDLANITVEATVQNDAASVVQVRFNIGGDTTTLSAGFTAGATTTDSATVNVGSIGGAGRVGVTVQTRLVSGTAGELIDFRIQGNVSGAVTLPEPSDI